MTTTAIIGAGCSGLAAAHTLRSSGETVVLFEQSASVGGRCTTLARDGFISDSGAQYIKHGSPASVSLITERFRASDLIDIHKPVWIFDGQGQIQEGDSVQNAEPKWCYFGGLITLPALMAEALDIRTETPVTHVEQQANGWNLFAPSNRRLGTFERLLITIPAPEASELMQASQLDRDLQESVLAQLSQARYNSLLSVMLGYHPRLRTRPYYALVNTDKAHAVSWLAWEHEKTPARAPQDSGLLIAQMAPQYSKEHWQMPDEEVFRDVSARVSTLIAETLPAPIFTALQRWRYALPATKADADTLNAVTIPHGLAFCGDSFTGGRVHLALEHGISVAQQLSHVLP